MKKNWEDQIGVLKIYLESRGAKTEGKDGVGGEEYGDNGNGND